MVNDDMQYIFLCPKCGAQNVVGQLACQSCGQRFQYNCPYCGCAVDSSLVNCPNCRESLNWPVPQKVKAFPRQKKPQKTQQRTPSQAHPSQAYPSQAHHQMPGGVGEKPPQKKRDPWLTGCLIVIIIVVLIGGAIFVYDTLSQPTAPVTTPPVSENESSIHQFQNEEFMRALIAGKPFERMHR